MKAGRIAWSIVGMLSLSAAARAGPVTWQFSGQVTSIYDPNGALGGAVVPGSPVTGYTNHSSSLPIAPPRNPGFRAGAVAQAEGRGAGNRQSQARTGIIGTAVGAAGNIDVPESTLK